MSFKPCHYVIYFLATKMIYNEIVINWGLHISQPKLRTAC